MPCLNEAEAIGTCIHKAQQFLQDYGITGEVVVADNGSTDGSQEIAKKCGARVISVPKKGYGQALMGGINAAKGKYIIMGDADGTYDFTALEPFLTKLREGSDLVVGNRFKGGIAPGAMPALHKFLGNPLLTGIGRLFFNCPCRDFHCGLRGFSKAAIKKMDLRTTGMEFATEMVVKATLLKMRVTEVPTTLSADCRGRPSHLRRWRDGWRHLRFLLLYSPRWLFLYPGTVLMTVGILLGLLVLPGPRKVGSTILDIHTLAFAAAMIITGFQAIIFAIYSKTFAINEGLLPPDSKMDKLYCFITLEVGLACGAVLLLLGLAGAVYALSSWGKRSFGSMDPVGTMRIVIPSATMLALGTQIIFSSFFLSLLGLKRGKERSEKTNDAGLQLERRNIAYPHR